MYSRCIKICWLPLIRREIRCRVTYFSVLISICISNVFKHLYTNVESWNILLCNIHCTTKYFIILHSYVYKSCEIMMWNNDESSCAIEPLRHFVGFFRKTGRYSDQNLSQPKPFSALCRGTYTLCLIRRAIKQRKVRTPLNVFSVRLRGNLTPSNSAGRLHCHRIPSKLCYISF